MQALGDPNDEVALNLAAMFANVTNDSAGLARSLANSVVPPLVALLRRVAVLRSKKGALHYQKPILRECLLVIRNLSHDSGGNAACDAVLWRVHLRIQREASWRIASVHVAQQLHP